MGSKYRINVAYLEIFIIKVLVVINHKNVIHEYMNE